MAKLIVTEFVTLDGIMEAPGGEPGHPHSGWVFDYIGPEQEKYKMEETLEAESQLIGRVTYESFAGAWPQRKGPFADHFNSMKKHVVSSTMPEPLEWENSTLVKGDVVTEVAKLKESEGGPILVAGSGKRVFPESDQRKSFKLVDSQTFSTDVQANAYVRA